MNPEQKKDRAAQPADEELKKHGDQLKKQVDAVSAGARERDTTQHKEDEDRKE